MVFFCGESPPPMRDDLRRISLHHWAHSVSVRRADSPCVHSAAQIVTPEGPLGSLHTPKGCHLERSREILAPGQSLLALKAPKQEEKSFCIGFSSLFLRPSGFLHSLRSVEMTQAGRCTESSINCNLAASRRRLFVTNCSRYRYTIGATRFVTANANSNVSINALVREHPVPGLPPRGFSKRIHSIS